MYKTGASIHAELRCDFDSQVTVQIPQALSRRPILQELRSHYPSAIQKRSIGVANVYPGLPPFIRDLHNFGETVRRLVPYKLLADLKAQICRRPRAARARFLLQILIRELQHAIEIDAGIGIVVDGRGGG